MHQSAVDGVVVVIAGSVKRVVNAMEGRILQSVIRVGVGLSSTCLASLFLHAKHCHQEKGDDEDNDADCDTDDHMALGLPSLGDIDFWFAKNNDNQSRVTFRTCK